MSLRTESPHDYQTANPLKNSRFRKFPRPKRAPSYWLWHVILTLLQLYCCIQSRIIMVEQGSLHMRRKDTTGKCLLSWSGCNYSRGSYVWCCQHLTHRHIQNTLCVQELPGPWACFVTGHVKQHLLLKRICYLRWLWELCVFISYFYMSGWKFFKNCDGVNNDILICS
jgi:hypothetical protein